MSVNNKVILVPFAQNAGATYRYSIPQTNTTSDENKASYAIGFPAVTMEDVNAGGIPPFGQDLNGILFDITTAIQYIQAGEFQRFNSEFANEIGGYSIGALVKGSNNTLYQSTANENFTDPVTGGSWVEFGKGDYLSLTGGTLTGDLTLSGGRRTINFLPGNHTIGANVNFGFNLTGVNGVKTSRLWFDASKDKWVFENSIVTIDGKVALKTGDAGLNDVSPVLPAGTDFSSDVVTSKNQSFTLSGKYKGTPNDSATWGGILEVKRRFYDQSTGCVLTIYYNNKIYECEGNRINNVWIWDKWKEILTSISQISDYPVGSPIPWPLKEPPVGYLLLDGSVFNKSTYPQLATAYPSGTLPDLRGEFIRGYDGGRGVDAGRELLSQQGDAIRNIYGWFGGRGLARSNYLDANGAFRIDTSFQAYDSNSSSLETSTHQAVAFNASYQVPTANENRPRNIAFNYIVKAA